MKNKLIICMECLSYDFLDKCRTPNIKSLNPHPATAYGTVTRASVPALLGGLLPVCRIESCEHRRIAKEWHDPFLLSKYKRKGHLLLYIPNGWIYELIRPFIDLQFREKLLKWSNHLDELPTKEMIKDFLGMLPELEKPYFAYFQCMETHPPFFSPEGSGDRKRAVEYIDEVIEPLLELDCEIVVTSDHDFHTYGSMDNEGKHLEVFIATKSGKDNRRSQQ